MTLDPLTALKLLASKWRTSASTLLASADEAASEFRTGSALDDSEPASVRGVRDVASSLLSCALEVEVIVERAERRDLVASEWGR